MSKIKKH